MRAKNKAKFNIFFLVIVFSSVSFIDIFYDMEPINYSQSRDFRVNPLSDQGIPSFKDRNSLNLNDNPSPLAITSKIESSPTIGIIVSHNENNLQSLYNYYYDRGYWVEYIYSSLDSIDLDQYDLIIVGEYGEVWDYSEVIALEDYIFAGGKLVSFGDSQPADGLQKIANSYGIEFLGYTIGSSGSTANFDTSTSNLFDNVQLLYISSNSALTVENPAIPVIWDSTTTGIYGASVAIGKGNLLVLAHDFQNYLWDYDNHQLISNLPSWEDYSELVFTSSIYTNTSYNLTWEYNFGVGETPISNEIFIDEVSQGTTSEAYYPLPIGSEGIYNISLSTSTNLASTYHRWFYLTVDFTSPNIIPVFPINNSIITDAYSGIYWTISENLSGIYKQELYQTHVASGIKEPLVGYFNQDFGHGNTSFSRDGSYYIDIIVTDRAGNSNSSRIFVSADINAIGFPSNHAQDTLFNIMNYYRSIGCYIEFENSSDFLITEDWLNRMDMVFLGGTGYISYTRDELLLLEDWFTTGGTVVNVGGFNTSLSYTRWLSKLGLTFGQEIGSVYSSYFDGSSSLVSGLGQLYFSNAKSCVLSNSFTPLVWDQSGVHVLVTELSSLGRFIAIGGYFDDGIWTVDNTELLDNLLAESHNQNTQEVALIPSTLYSRLPTTTINWTFSLGNISYESAAIWYNDVLQGNVTGKSFELIGLTEGFHNLTLLLYTNTSETIRCEREIWVDFSQPFVHEFLPSMNQTIKTAYSNASWNVTDNLSGILYESLIVDHPNASDIVSTFIDPFNSSYSSLTFFKEGTYILQLKVVDWVGNQKLVNTTVHVSYIATGFIEAHGEYSLSNIRNYCYNFNGNIETLIYGSHITYDWLERFDSVWIGFGGNPWSTIELNALNDYFESGGTIIFTGRAGYRTSIQSWFDLIGLGNNTQGPYSMYTTTLLYQYPIFENVTQIYLDSAYSWSIKNNDIKPIGWSQDGFYNVISALNIVGTAYLFSGDISSGLYFADNPKLVENIILEANEQITNSISVDYSSLFQNSNNFSISWEYDLNKVLEKFEIYIDSVYQGNTTSTSWNFPNLAEGTYNLTIVMLANDSSSCSFSNSMIVDLTAPNIVLNSPLDGEIINRTYLSINGEATDSESYIIKEKYYWIPPGDSSWEELSGNNGSEVIFPTTGEYRFMFSAWDRAGNRKDQIVEFSVDYLAVGFIQNHDEYSLWNIYDYYYNQQCYTEYLRSPYKVTDTWLIKFDLVFIGYGGYLSWTTSELDALNYYINSGGYLVYSGRDTYSTPLENWMNNKGISFYSSGPGTIYTSEFEDTNPIFDSINELYFRYTYRSWSLSSSANPIIWTNDRQYIIGAQYENFGRFFAFSGDIDYRTYYANNQAFLWNILQEATRFREGVLIDPQYLTLNNTNATIYWDWYLRNQTLDYFNISLEGEYQGSTNTTSWQFTNLTEGVYNITITLITNTSEVFTDSKDLIIDLTSPSLLITKPTLFEVTNSTTEIEWTISDNLSGISQVKVYLRSPTNETWTEHTYPPINENGTIVQFWEGGIYLVHIIITDYAGNSVEQLLEFDVQIPTIGFVGTHDEFMLYEIQNFFMNLGYFTYPLYYNNPVTEEWLNSIDLLFIGYGGSFSWTIAELNVLDSFMDSGGDILYMGRGSYNIPLETWLQGKGIQPQYEGPGYTVTNKFNLDFNFFTGVSNLYIPYADRSWFLSGEAVPIIWSNDESVAIGAYYQNVGSLIALSGDFNYYIYDYDNEIFLQNLVEMAVNPIYGIYFKYSNLTTNQSSPTVEWNVALENSIVDHFEFYLDDINLGSTTNYFWELNSLNEGTYEVKVVLYDNNSITYEHIKTLTIDISPPIVSLINPKADRISSQYTILEWNITDNLSDVLKFTLEIKRPGYSSFEVMNLDPYNPYQYSLNLYDEGSCQVRITAWDRAGNKKTSLFDLTVDFYRAGMIRNHGENRISAVRSYIQNQGYYVDYLYEGTAVTLDWLNLYDLIIIGPFGYIDWTGTELQALESYLENGGWIIHEIVDSNSPLLPWLNSKGLIYNSQNIGTVVTDQFTDSFLFENVTNLYFPNVQSTWTTSGSAECLIQDSSGIHCLAAAIESMGMFITFTGQMLEEQYVYDNSQFLNNLLMGTMEGINGIRIKGGSSKAINSDSYSINWFSKSPDNALIENFKIYLNGNHLSTTNENFYELQDLIEGTYTISVQALLSTSEILTDTQELIVDFTSPGVEIKNPTDSEVLKTKIITFQWDVIENLSGVSRSYIERWNSTSNQWVIIFSSFSNVRSRTTIAQFSGENTYRVRVIDHAGNEGQDQVNVTIDLLEILFTLSHGEYLSDWYDNHSFHYYFGLHTISKFTEDSLSPNDLITTDLVIVLGGRYSWSDSEIDALTNHLVHGGALLVMGEEIPSALNDLLEIYGLRLIEDQQVDLPAGSYPTGNITHPLFQNVTKLTLPTDSSYITVNYPSKSLLTDSTGEYTLIGALDSGIKILVISCSLYYNYWEPWDNNTLQFFDNILTWVTPISTDSTPSANNGLIGLITAFFLIGMVGAASILVMIKFILPFLRKTG